MYTTDGLQTYMRDTTACGGGDNSRLVCSEGILGCHDITIYNVPDRDVIGDTHLAYSRFFFTGTSASGSGSGS